MRLLCRAHNQYEAERVFGAGFMSEKREAAQRARAARAAARIQAAVEAPARATASSAPAEARARAVAPSAPAAAAERSAGPSRQPSAEPLDDLHVALRRLGYRKDELRRATELCAAFPGASLEEQVRLALRHL
jgi:hypothetical protein